MTTDPALIRLQEDVKLILTTLKGDEKLGINGLVQEIRQLKQEQMDTERELKSVKKLIDRGKWFLMGGVVFGGYGLYDLIHEFILKAV